MSMAGAGGASRVTSSSSAAVGVGGGVRARVGGGGSGGGRLPADLSTVEFETSEDLQVLTTFDEMGLKEDLIRGIYAYGILILPPLHFFFLPSPPLPTYTRISLFASFCGHHSSISATPCR